LIDEMQKMNMRMSLVVEQSHHYREAAKNNEVLKDVSRSTHLEGTSHKNRNDVVITEEKNRSQERGRVFFLCEK